MKKKLTLARRRRIAAILSTVGEGVGIDAKAQLVARGLGEPCTHGQALSLLAQCRKPKKVRRTCREEINRVLFEQICELRKDVY